MPRRRAVGWRRAVDDPRPTPDGAGAGRARGRAPSAAPKLNRLEAQIQALNQRFGAWSEDASIDKGRKFEAAFTQFFKQLSSHLSFGGISNQPLSIKEVQEVNADLSYTYSDAAELVAEAAALTRWHLFNRYRRQTLYLVRGISTHMNLEKAKETVSPAWFPTSTTSNFDVATKLFSGSTGTTYIFEVDVNDIMYTYEISPEMRRRFSREQEYILRPGARPTVLDAASAPELKLWYNGVDNAPRER